MIWLNASTQISKLTDDLVVVAAGFVVADVVKFDVAPSDSGGIVVVIVAVVDVVVVVITVISMTDVNESNAPIQLDESIVGGVSA